MVECSKYRIMKLNITSTSRFQNSKVDLAKNITLHQSLHQTQGTHIPKSLKRVLDNQIKKRDSQGRHRIFQLNQSFNNYSTLISKIVNIPLLQKC